MNYFLPNNCRLGSYLD